MSEPEAPTNFVAERVREDLASGKISQVQTRFPPEPNGYLHIGHAKTICLNFGLAREHKGRCNLRFDDTNPAKEETRFVDAIQEDVRWLGFDWDELRFASDVFEELYGMAVTLIKAGKAYVCDLSAEEMSASRGTTTKPGTNSPYRDRSVEENLDLFERMRAGEFEDGSRTLRARIDMAHPNFNMRDPAMYRILRRTHHRTGDDWCIYPTYDFTHGQCDALETITHSICTLEFEHHRPLYDWYIKELGLYPSQQIEIAPLNLAGVVLSKRHLKRLVDEGHVSGWDDPRLPTLAGLRRRGVPPEAIRAFCAHIGVTKFEATHSYGLFEKFIRDDLNKRAPRYMAVLDPIKLVLTNLPEGHEERCEAVNNPEDPSAGTRQIPLGRELLIEREDFMEEPSKAFFRLAPGRAVRLRYAFIIDCTGVVKDEAGEVLEVHATVDTETRAGGANEDRKVKGTIHWVSAAHAVEADARLYESLLREAPEDEAEAAEGEGYDIVKELNPASMAVVPARCEPALAELPVGTQVQFERNGYFVVDADSDAERRVFNRIVTLRSAFKPAKKEAPKKAAAPAKAGLSNKKRKLISKEIQTLGAQPGGATAAEVAAAVNVPDIEAVAEALDKLCDDGHLLVTRKARDGADVYRKE